MTELYDAAEIGDLERLALFVEQGIDKNQSGGWMGRTALSAAACDNHLAVVQYLVEQGADMEKGDSKGSGFTPLLNALVGGHLDVVHYLLEQGADRDKADNRGRTPLHWAANHGHLETAKLLMVYGADLNARNDNGQLPIDMGGAITEEIKQAIRDEPRRRMDEAPGKRATEQGRHPNAAASASAQQDEDDNDMDEGSSNKRPRLNEGEAEAEVNVAEEDEDSEPSDEDNDWLRYFAEFVAVVDNVHNVTLCMIICFHNINAAITCVIESLE